MSEEVTELGFAVDVVEAMEAQGRWPDLTRLAARKPEILKAAVWMLGHSVPVRDVCKALSLSPCTVSAIQARHPDAVVTQKRQVAAMRRLAIQLGMERVVELARDGKLTVFDLKLLWDMEQVESGGVTERRELVVSGDAEQAVEFYERLRERAGALGDRIVLEAEILGATGAEAGAGQNGGQMGDQGPGSPLEGGLEG